VQEEQRGNVRDGKKREKEEVEVMSQTGSGHLRISRKACWIELLTFSMISLLLLESMKNIPPKTSGSTRRPSSGAVMIKSIQPRRKSLAIWFVTCLIVIPTEHHNITTWMVRVVRMVMMVMMKIDHSLVLWLIREREALAR